MPDLDPCTVLRQLDRAWFDLNSGGSVREIRDQNGEVVVYNGSNRAGLLSAIATLQPQCLTYQAVALGSTRTRPMRFLF